MMLFLSFLSASEITLNFQNLQIKDFIKMVAKITHKNILITNEIIGKVNFISVKPIKEQEIYPILVNVLRSKGYTIIQDNNGFLKVVRNSEAIRNAPPLAEKNNLYEIETDIIYLKNISARRVYSQISYLLSRYGKIVINNEKNMLIITDYPDNLKVIKEIIKKIDTINNKKVKIIFLKYANVNKVFSQITDIASMLFPPGVVRYKILKSETSNSIILVGADNVINKLQTIVKTLDKKPKPINKVISVITLKNSDVSQMTKIISNLINNKFISKNFKPSITADKETNSLIILATPEQLELIKSLIKQLDIPKKQVYVKARILEISNSKASQVGLKFGLFGGSATTSGIYTLSANLGGPALAFNPTDLGLSIPTLKEGLALGATLDLLETYGAAKKLSEPSILCINNTPSTIYVGKTVSVLTGKTTSTVTSESYAREDIGLTLKVIPRIDSDNKVSLKISTDIEDILPGSQVGLPITSKRELSTTAIVKNGQSIIIGGLVKNNNDVTLEKVPILGDLPFLGALFRHKENNKDKTTLVIMLTPYIVNKSEDLDKLRFTLAKLDALERQFVEKIKKKKSMQIKKRERNNEGYDLLGEHSGRDF